MIKWIIILFSIISFHSIVNAGDVVYCPSSNVINNGASCSSWITQTEFSLTNPSWNMRIWNWLLENINIDGWYNVLRKENFNLIGGEKFIAIEIEWIENNYANQILMNQGALNLKPIIIDWIYSDYSKQMIANIWVWTMKDLNIDGIESSYSKQLMMNIGSNTDGTKSVLQRLLIDSNVSVAERDFLTYFANWNNSEKTNKGYKEITICWKDVNTWQNSCRIYYVWIWQNTLGDYGFIIKALDSWINETTEVYPTKITNTEALFCVKGSTICYLFNDVKKTITNQNLNSIPLSNIVVNGNDLIYI